MNILWKSEERIIPGHGVATPGKAIDLPDPLALKYIMQGDAVKPKKTEEEKS